MGSELDHDWNGVCTMTKIYTVTQQVNVPRPAKRKFLLMVDEVQANGITLRCEVIHDGWLVTDYRLTIEGTREDIQRVDDFFAANN